MELRWNLDALYTSFESEDFKKDMNYCEQLIGKVNEWAEKNLTTPDFPVNKIEEYIKLQNEFYNLFTRLVQFGSLTLSVEAKNEKAQQITEKLQNKYADLTKASVKFQIWLATVDNLEAVVEQSEILKEYKFYLMEITRANKYLLSEKEEMILAKMANTGSESWTKLQELLTSTLVVDINIEGEEKKLPLSVIRNMAYDKDSKVRKKAYEAELNCYDKIAESSAACLNGIKGEVITICELKGFESVLDKTLIESRMNRETLQAMLTAMEESLPAFHKYYKKKAEFLGYTNGLPFFELFAPIGKIDKTFTYDQARIFIVDNFRNFSNELADFAEKAFEDSWIDAEPRDGKRGGAFCSNLIAIKQSRVLTNFTGSFSNVTTLAHELGHAYHGECLKKEAILNTNYPMPIAETASIFCETIIKNSAVKNASEEEAFGFLEAGISDAGQVIVDIYSRYLFESELFNRRKECSLSVNELKDVMISAQKTAYGDALDWDFLHPYMWVCKPHYYYAETNFYNFPYAFGLLFAMGLYSEYLKQGGTFIEKYNKLLAATGKNDIVEITKMVGIDITTVEFWRGSLRLIEEDIEKFIKLSGRVKK